MNWQRHLRIVDSAINPVPPPAGVKIAFATADRKQVDQHFGAARALVIYAVTPTQATLVAIAQFGVTPEDGHEDKLAARLAALEDCAAVYCQAVGGSAIRQLRARGVQPLRVDGVVPIDQLLQELQAEWRSTPAGWLTKALRRQEEDDHHRFAVMEAEGWRE